MPTLHLICGLPGSGKSTLARRLEAESGVFRLTSDEWLQALGADGYDIVARAKVEALQWGLAQQLLARGIDVVLEAGFWTRAERDLCKAGAAALGARVRLHYLEVPLEDLKRRIVERNADPPPGVYAVNPDDLEGWLPLFEAPTEEELSEV
jgi:predicted kinase